MSTTETGTDASTVGVIGLGRMGSRMAERLLETGFDVVGSDVRDEAVDRLREAGGEGATSPAAVAEAADIVVTSLPNPDVVEAVFAGEDGILTADAEGLTVLDTSTSTPETTRTLAEVGREEGIRVVDAPVSGGTSGARAGTLTLMIGAEEGGLDDRTTAVVEALAANAFHLGDVGAGHTTKLVNNVLTAGHRVLAMEAMALGVAQGVAPERLFEVIATSSGSSNQFEKRVPRVLNRNFEPTFTVDLTKKDVRLALGTADDIDYPMAVTSLVHELHKEASARGYGEEDACAVVKLFEENADVLVEAATEVDESFDGY